MQNDRPEQSREVVPCLKGVEGDRVKESELWPRGISVLYGDSDVDILKIGNRKVNRRYKDGSEREGETRRRQEREKERKGSV